jgi:uncharacterized membrane protein
MTLEFTLRALGDGLSILSLSLISSMALAAWKRIPKGVKVPMQWNNKGVPSWRASKPFALLFAPVMVAVLLFVPTLLGSNKGATDLSVIIVPFAIRSIAAAVFVIIFMHYLKQVYQTLQDEGSLSS